MVNDGLIQRGELLFTFYNVKEVLKIYKSNISKKYCCPDIYLIDELKGIYQNCKTEAQIA